uniref:SEC63 domain-containing protein n=1 Tax=Caenorhabditis tropicalis TaxID=1561998 RepID=A0A1I7T7Q4_9PELO
MLSDNDIWYLLGHKVQIELDTGDVRRNESTTGHLMTRDPVSHSLVIAKLDEENCVKEVEWIPSSSVKSLKPLEDTKNNPDEVNTIFDKYLEEKESDSSDSEETIKNRGLKVISYLKSHHLDVDEKPNGTFIIAGTVRFERPYNTDNFYCDIPIVLKRILKLVGDIDT